jgi:acyl-CoA synthetase (AMP-forming)/AMP-acid ligase II
MAHQWEYFSSAIVQPNTVIDILQWRAQYQDERLAYRFLVDGESEEICLTYAVLDQQARALTAKLQSLKKCGARALLLYPPGLDFIVAYVGCLYGGIIAIPAYPPHPSRADRTLPKIIGIVNDAEPAFVLTTSSLLSTIKDLLAQIPKLKEAHCIATDNIATDEWAGQWRKPALGRDTLAFLQYTSGSTTSPKGVMLSHGNLMHNLAVIEKCFEHSAASCGVSWLPPYHDMGLIGGILQPLYSGFPVTFMSPVHFLQRPIRWLQAISRFRATGSGGPNFAYDLCVRKIKPEQRGALDLSRWEVAFNGAEPINHKTLEQFADYFAPCGFRREAFYPCYGLAEATLMVSGGLKTAPPVTKHFQAAALERNQVRPCPVAAEATRALVGCGQNLREQKILIVDPETLTPCAFDQIGEIWIAGPSVARGYWNKPAETSQTFQAFLADSNKGPFLRTGDFGFVHEGELFVTGRCKDVIIIDGSNHYPQDIEKTVEDCYPAIRPTCCAAFGINVAGGEQLVVVAEVERRLPLHVEEMINAIRRAIAEHHELCVHDIMLIRTGSIPKTSSGKIQRYACRAGYLAGTLETVA